MVKDNAIKSIFRLHEFSLFLEKNVNNPLEKKLLLSLGVDISPDDTKSLVFKVWDFMSLDTYSEYAKDKLTGGSASEARSIN